jgi:hypothetical protein
VVASRILFFEGRLHSVLFFHTVCQAHCGAGGRRNYRYFFHIEFSEFPQAKGSRKNNATFSSAAALVPGRIAKA